MTKGEPISPEQRERMVTGIRSMNAVNQYLKSIQDGKPRGRPVDPAAIQLKIDAEQNLARKVILIAKLHEALRTAQTTEAEDAFVEHAPAFSQRHNITYAAWREMGVPVEVLTKCGIKA